MRRIVGTVFQSLDGVMQAPGGPAEDPTGGFALGGWQMTFQDEVAGAALGAVLTPPFALLLGRRTYDIFASYWPFVEGEAAAVARALNEADKYMMTRGRRPLDWGNSHRVESMEDLAAIRGGDGPDLRIWGSGTLYPALLSAGLLDEVTTLTYPLVLGGGKRTFGEGTAAAAMRLKEHRVGPTGVIIATYSPDGAVRIGSAESDPTNEREAERQRRMADGSW